MAERYEMRMPDLAATESQLRIIRWLVSEGEAVRRGQTIVEVETDKATMEVEAAVNGVVLRIAAGADAKVSPGEVIAVLETEALPVGMPSEARTQTLPAAATAAAMESAPAPGRSAPAGGGGMFARNRARPVQVPPAARAQTDPDAPFLLGLYDRMVRVREFEEGVKLLFLQGTMPGTIHQCQGQEATAVGVCAALREDDFITSTFRGHGHALAKGLSMQELLNELYGAASGCCGGKGGSMHVGNMKKGMLPGIAIVAGGIPLAAGMALAMKMRKTGQIVACFFGDGAVSEGAFHEGVNMAAIWGLPVIFACENNLYGASTRVDRVMKNPRISERAACYGIPGRTVDGNDVLAVYQAAQAAAEECRSGNGPVLLELETYRRTGHSRRDPCHYQPKDEREAWFSKDPIERFGRVLIERRIACQDQLDAVRARAADDFRKAVEMARKEPLPTAADLTTNVLV